ncbi:MAG: hypothetical protein JSS86_17630, partial [Cyanobacteria bacterium SZAS LIN-2]|nr:hypothetical protein [Cyanobacteria bacterium SZAS LIN-2]
MSNNVAKIGSKRLPVLMAFSFAALAFVGCSMNGNVASVRSAAAKDVASNNYAAAESKLKLAIDDKAKGDGAVSPDQADLLIDLGKVYAKEGKAAEAAQAFKKASDIQQKDMKPQMIALTRSLNGLGLAYMRQG